MLTVARIVLRTLPSVSGKEIRRHAGHSKWANIKHIKAVKDAQKGALFTKLNREIKVAIQEGNSADPSSNLRLSQVIERARRLCMPAASIQAALKRGYGQKTEGQYKRVIMEIRGPAGSVLLCEVFTENMQRVKHQISTAIKKHNVQFSGTASSALHLFEHKGVLEAVCPKQCSEDTITADAIECGAEDVSFIGDNMYKFICEPKQLKPMQSELETLGYTVRDAEVQYVPQIRVQLSEQDLEELAIIVDKLEAQEDVVRVYDNIG